MWCYSRSRGDHYSIDVLNAPTSTLRQLDATPHEKGTVPSRQTSVRGWKVATHIALLCRPQYRARHDMHQHIAVRVTLKMHPKLNLDSSQYQRTRRHQPMNVITDAAPGFARSNRTEE